MNVPTAHSPFENNTEQEEVPPLTADKDERWRKTLEYRYRKLTFRPTNEDWLQGRMTTVDCIYFQRLTRPPGSQAAGWTIVWYSLHNAHAKEIKLRANAPAVRLCCLLIHRR